jgi:hypothetical protein
MVYQLSSIAQTERKLIFNFRRGCLHYLKQREVVYPGDSVEVVDDPTD